MNKKKVLCFDFDGTLVDSAGLERESILRTLHYFGHEEYDEENIDSLYGPTEPGIIRHILGEEEFPASLPYFFQTYSELQSELLKENPKITSLLTLLKKNYPETKLLLITGRSQETMEISLEYLKYNPFFEKTYSGSEDGINKGENMKAAMDDYGFKKEDMIYIGDTTEDIMTMKENGFDILSVGYYHDIEYQKKLSALNPNTVTTVEELEGALLRIL